MNMISEICIIVSSVLIVPFLIVLQSMLPESVQNLLFVVMLFLVIYVLTFGNFIDSNYLKYRRQSDK